MYEVNPTVEAPRARTLETTYKHAEFLTTFGSFKDMTHMSYI